MRHWGIIVIILCWLGYHLIYPINLLQSDLGIHIKNGELLYQGHWDVLYKNYYSFSNPDYQFLNYSWLFDLFCYFSWKLGGFVCLSLMFMIIELSAFYAFLQSCKRHSSFILTCAIALLAFPFISSRSEIRPEGISYLCCGLFWLLIDLYQQKRFKAYPLIIALSVIQVIWVNAHIFFFLGPMLIILFIIQARINREQDQVNILQRLFFILIGLSLINPFGASLLLLPFETLYKSSSTISQYPILESLSIYFYFFKAKVYFALYKYFLSIAFLLSVILIVLIYKEGFKKYIVIGLLTSLLTYAALTQVRMLGLFGYFLIPILTYVFNRWLIPKSEQYKRQFEAVLLILGIIVSGSVSFNWHQDRYLGLIPGNDKAIKFIKNEHITGVIYNNCDIANYLIFYLSPEHKIFIDPRGLAAYPQSFFMNKYLHMQNNDNIWREQERKFHFDVAIISIEQSSLGFIKHQFNDNSWAAVFNDNKVIVFLKRNKQNIPIIMRNEISLSPSEKIGLASFGI